jgi:hypothetical protein
MERAVKHHLGYSDEHSPAETRVVVITLDVPIQISNNEVYDIVCSRLWDGFKNDPFVKGIRKVSDYVPD